jgi:hypothetical protein
MPNALGSPKVNRTIATPGARPFPPARDYTSLAVSDLLEAREQYHVHLSRLPNVAATAIGRYLIHEKDWYATHPPDQKRPDNVPRVTDPRTLDNSVVRPWSWPAVLVFVRQWDVPQRLGSEIVPKALYLPDGRVIPTCVVLAPPDETPPPPVPGPSQVSPLLGGGYSCLRQHQGVEHTGTFGCLVYRAGTYYALTNRHVAGAGQEEIRAFVHGEYHRIGTSAELGLTRRLLNEVFPAWPGRKTYLTIDAGLVRIDDFEDWTSQVFGIGEVGEIFDATENSVTLDLIETPVRAFGGTSGVMEGRIRGLFFRYSSLGGFDYATDVLIGARQPRDDRQSTAPFTRPGDSGTLWFYDPPNKSENVSLEIPAVPSGPARGLKARRLRPVAMQWGGERFRVGGRSSAFALATFASTICAALDVEMVRDWSTGHDEYWGKLGHFAIGWKACDLLSGSLSTLMTNNQPRIGFGDDALGLGSGFKMGAGAYVPLADVPDYVWIFSGRESEPIQHFADIDIRDIDGGPSLIERCVQDSKNVSATVWKQYFDGFAAAGVGPEEGVLPFRVWQIWEAMVAYLKAKDALRFVAAAGVLAHYVGDASQPLHCSYLHHGVPPMQKVHGRNYPVPRDSKEFKAFKKTRPAEIHSIYEETMLEVDTPTALALVDTNLKKKGTPAKVKSGHDAAVQTLLLMHAAQQRLAPKTIINADKPNVDLGPQGRAKALWKKASIRDATIASLADSVRLLRDLWTSAWKAGNGDSLAKSKLVEIAEQDLEGVYRSEPKFVPSLSLEEMASSQDFEP